jgi:hypothetical protein
MWLWGSNVVASPYWAITKVSLFAAGARLKAERNEMAKKKTIFFIGLSPCKAFSPRKITSPSPLFQRGLGVPFFNENKKFVTSDGDFAKAGMCLQRE